MTIILCRVARLIFLCLPIGGYLFSTPAHGEFTTILNIPPNPNFGNSQTIGSDTQLNLFANGSIGGQFSAGASDGTSTNVEVNISGGSVGDFFDAYAGSTVNISGGSVGVFFNALRDSMVNISGGLVGSNFDVVNSTVTITGGSVGDFFDTFGASTVNISGGSVGDGFDVFAGSTVNISGGSVGDVFAALSGSRVTITGGSIGDSFGAHVNSTVNLVGSQFILDGLSITSSLATGNPVTITDRNVTLEGLFADGSPFSFDLNSTTSLNEDFFDLNALLTITLVTPGDFNGDGEVDGADFLRWQRGDSPQSLSTNDLSDWESNYGSSILTLPSLVAVPEVDSLAMVAMASIVSISRRRRKPTFRRSR